MDAALQAWLPASWTYWITSLAIYATLFVASDLSYRMIEQPGRRWVGRFASVRM